MTPEDIIILLFLISLSAFFSSAESALISAPEVKIKSLRDKYIERLKSREQDVLISILIWNNLVNVMLSIYIGYLVERITRNLSLSIATAIATFIIVTFGEIVPKSLAINLKEKLLKIYSKILYFAFVISLPIVKIYSKLINRITKETTIYYTEEELIVILGLTKLKDFERFLVKQVLLLDSKTVGDIIIPKDDVQMVPESFNLRMALETMLEHGYSKIVTYSRDTNNITGYITIKDIIKHINNLDMMKVKDVKHDILFLPEYTKVLDAIIMFKKHKSPIAAIVDEYGNFLGIITLKDIVEEVFGEIEEWGEAKRQNVIEYEKILIVEGDVTIEDLNTKYKLNLPKNENYNTISGLILYKLGRFPKEGEKIHINGLDIIADKVSKNKIIRVKIIKS